MLVFDTQDRLHIPLTTFARVATRRLSANSVRVYLYAVLPFFTFTLDPDTDFASGETCTVSIFAGQVTDQDSNDPPDSMAANFMWTFTTSLPPSRIHDIQGAAHTSPKVGQAVSGVGGIVTALRTNGFYLQDPSPDADDATSEALFVFTRSAPTVAVGDSLTVSGTVTEFRPGGSSSSNLTTTELTSPSIAVLSSGNPLPPPVVIGTGGRIPPAMVIEDDATGTVESSGVFDPTNDGLDFYESLEGMRVQVNSAVAVGPSSNFSEIPVLGDDGVNASVRTARGGIIIRPGDFNPERIIIDNEIVPTPQANVADRFTTSLVGVLDYSFGNYKLHVTAPVSVVSGGLAQETTTASGTNQVAIATFNVENLRPGDPPSKFSTLANLIVANLKAPDIIAVEEVQDNNGATNDAVVDASQTYNALIAAIQAAGGPAYQFRQIDPVDDQDGGEPGGNNRQGFLFRTDRGLSFVDRPGGTSTVGMTVVAGPTGPQLSFSPDPTNSAFNNSRKPLAGEFLFNGHRLFAIANHFNSKGGDHPLFGRFQPPVLSSEVQRQHQAQIVHDFVASLLAVDPNADIVVLGGLNDFEFSAPMATLKGSSIILNDLIETLPPNERYTYVFEGNSQTLDHTLLSQHLFARPRVSDVVHVNSEFATQASDHEPQVVRITLNDPPTVAAGGPYTVDEGASTLVTATGNDPEGGALAFAWDLDNNGTFETPGQSVSLSASNFDGPSSRTIAVQATDNGGLTANATATASVVNVPPVAVLSAPTSVFAGSAFVLSLQGASDPAPADLAAGFTYAFDCGDGAGYGAFSGASTASCPTSDSGTRTVKGTIRDKDNGVREYTRSVAVVVTYDLRLERVRRASLLADEVWDDRAEQDAEQLVGLLFVAAEALRRSDITEAMRLSPARRARACALLQADPLRGLRLEDAGDRLGLVSAPACTATVERYLGKRPREALSNAALEVLAIVAYEQPLTRADIRSMRGVDSDAVVETLMARKLIAEDPRFGGRGRARLSDDDGRLPAAIRAELARQPSASARPSVGRNWTACPSGCFRQCPVASHNQAAGRTNCSWLSNTWNSNHAPR